LARDNTENFQKFPVDFHSLTLLFSTDLEVILKLLSCRDKLYVSQYLFMEIPKSAFIGNKHHKSLIDSVELSCFVL
jgi:hypothetical protein